MTATSPIRHKRRLGLPSMESLGFDEAAFDSSETVSTHKPIGRGTTTLTTVRGKHTKRGVEGLWDTTTMDAPSLVDWSPQEIGKILKRRRIRRTPIILTVLLVALLSYFGYWLVRQPGEQAASAQKAVGSHAAALSSALQPALDLSVQLISGDIDDDYNAQLETIDDIAKELFGVSATLDASDDTKRALAANAASRALADTQRIRDAAAYRLTLEPALVMPELATDPELTTIPNATLEFGEWRASLDEVADLLPETGSEVVQEEFLVFRQSLPSAQREYVDALAGNDGFEALRVIQKVQNDIGTLLNTVRTTYEDLAADLKLSIVTTREDLARLVG